MNVLQNLFEFYNRLPLDSTYRVVVKGILENLDQVKDATIYDIAELTSSSRTTVWRMVQKIGYANFSEFRHALQSAVSQYTYYNRMLPPKDWSDPERLTGQISSQLRYAEEIFKDHCSPEQIAGMAKEVYEAESIRIYLPFPLPFVYSFQQNLAMTGKDTACFSLLPDILADAEQLNEKSIVFISTIEHAEAMSMQPVFETLRRRRARIWLAGGGGTQYRRFAERILIDEGAGILSWLSAFGALLLAVSEYYRAVFIDD